MKSPLSLKSRRMPRMVRKTGDSCYHVVSRVNGRAFLLTDTEKAVFRDLLRRVAAFCGVEVLTFAFLDNHFHLLVRVPAEAGDLSDEDLLERARLLYGKERKRQPLAYERIELALRAGGAVREGMRELLLGRMASLPMFVKILKQRFSIIYNRKHDRSGTLWEDRFHSVLVEDTAASLRAVAAYIDLNPVRAGCADDPKDYRFSGYGEAAARKGGLSTYALFLHLAKGRAASVSQVASAYRTYLYISGSDPSKGRAFREEDVRKVMKVGGKLSAAQLLRCRLRYMTQGVVIGTRAFVEEWAAGRSSARRKAATPDHPIMEEAGVHALIERME